MQKFYRICFLIFLGIGSNNVFSQYKDLPNPPSDLQTIPQGSLVIPMDNAHQNLFLTYPFNLKAYGLVNQLLQNDIPVKWVIKAGKAKDGIDFSATVERVYPSFVAASLQDFRASEFIVDSFWVNNPSPTTGQTATQVISTFANQWKVAVYRLTTNTTVDVRYTLDHRPKIALFNNGGNEAIAETILDTAKFTNYVVISAGVFPGLAQCYTFCSEMHWKMTDADTVITQKVTDFVNQGGNFFAQCHAVEGGDNLEGYERNEKFQTTTGLKELGLGNASNEYYNPDLAFMQFEGLMQPNENGSGKNWTFHAGSSWNTGVYHAVSTQNSLDTVIATGSHLAPPDSIGGNVFYLGGHNYKPYTSLLQINAARLYLNAALIPSARPTAFTVNAGSNTTICQGNSITLGGSPTGPVGATYIWSPASSLNNNTSPNPIATPTSSTLYTVVADNGGCTSNGAVTISVSAPPTVTASQNNVSCFGGSNGTATVSVSGGTPAYTYSWSNGQTTSSATGLIAGNYSVTTTDAAGCTKTSTVAITQPAAPLSSSASQNNVSCFGGSNGSTTVSVSGGTTAYTYLWSNGQTTSSATGLIAGNYSVTVTDSKGCTTTSTFSITQPVAPLSSSASQTNVSCNGGSNATATATASGGTTAYTYSWSNGQTTSSATNLSAGNYSVTITDSKGCTTTNTFSITQPAAPLASSASQNNVSCFGGSNGSTTVSVSGGTTAYTYLWNNSQTTSTISNLIAGNYSVTITDANGCTTTNTFTITQPVSPLSSSASQNNVSCFGGSNASASVSVSGGTPNYSYAWSNGQTTSSATNLSAGNYSVTVTDSKGCTTTSTFSITQPVAPLSSSASQNNVSCNGGSNGNATATASGGTTAYTYLWSNGQTTSSATNLSAGNYSVTITDANGCTTTNTFSITQPVILSSSASQNNVSCFGGSNASASVSVSGGTPNYNYSWSNGNSTSAISNLIAGNYSITITDANGCTTTNTFSITQPVILSSSASQTNVSCNGGSNGTATVSASGGTPAYTYSWSNGQTTSTATGLIAGNYSVTVTDSKGCTTTNTFSISQPTILTSTVTQTGVSCFGGNNGTATATVSGGTPSYTYLWTNGQTTSTATGLIAGNYSVTITDANGCTTTSTFSITQPFAPLSSSASQNNVSCNGGNNGTANVSTSGGTPNYTYSWSTGATTSAISNLTAGNYSVTITDSKGCTITSTFSITQPGILIASASQTNVSCNGGSNGTATAMPAGGTSPYTYYWSNGQTTSTATGLLSGNYTVTVTDMNGCTITGVISITQPFILTAGASQTNVSCFGGNNGSATVSPSGGTPAYSYLWSNGQTTLSATNLSAGNYSVTVTDANGCTASQTVTITQPALLTAAVSQTNVSCFGGNNGIAAVSPSGGTPSYSYLWSNGQTTAFATGLPAGNYTVTVTDSKGCTTTATVSITQPALLTASVSAAAVSCFGGSNGTATVTASGGTISYTYLWNNGQTTSTATGLIAGNYSVTITDANGCTTTNTVSITQPAAPLSSTASQTNVSCNGGSNGTATVFVSGGTISYTYLWNNGQTTSTATNLSAGNYSVTITDANGCTTTNIFSITEPTLLTSTASQINTCSGSSNGSAVISPSGGTPAYTYLWSNGQTTQTATGLPAGNYSATITDANGCTTTTTITITLFPAVSFSASQTNVSCFGGSNGSAADSAFGGTSPFTYLWSSGQTTSAITGLTAGNYTATITDANGCTIANTITITEPLLLAASTSVTASGCSSCTGTSTANASGGTSPYNYLWNPTGQTTQTATGLCAGTYTYVVSDANGCTASQTVTITGQLTLLTNSQTNVSCNGGSNGTAAVTATGGLSPYTYLWSNGQTTSSATGLSAGTYTLTVIDVLGCSNTQTITITQPAVLASTAAQTNVCSGASTGIAAVSASGGTAPYSYLWSTGATTVFITGLSAGSYTVTTTDANGCSSTATVITIIPFPAVLSATSQTNVLCFGGSNGSATDSAFGGTPGFTYLWSSGQTTSAIAGLSAGNYIATITDTNGCTKTDTIFITQPAVLLPNTSQTNVSCFGGSNGTAAVAAAGGTPSYSYLWSNGATTSQITNLTSQIYSVTITDANGCTTTDTILITQPALLTSTVSQTNVSCNGGSDGTAAANASGGTSPYSYLWSNGQTTSSATNLSAGNYFVTITDTNGCVTIDSAFITQPPVLSAVTNSAPDTCLQGNGTATVSVSGGTPSYSYLWNNGQTDSTATGLLPGNYSVTITDANGCTFSTTVTVNYTGSAVANAGPDASICFGSSASLNASGGISYTWSPVNGLSNPNISNPTANPTVTTIYIVTVTASNGCAALDTVAVTVNPLPTANAGADATICFSDSTTLNASGGSAYVWSPASGLNNANISNPAASPSSATNYTVTVTDANGCTNTDDITVTVNPLAVVSLNYSIIDGCAVPASVTFMASSDIGVTYLWDFGDSTTASGDTVVHIYTTSGTYYATVTVITADGCSTIVVANPPITIYPHPVADFTTSPSVNPMTIFHNTIDFSNQSSGATSYYWAFGDGGNSNNTDPQHTYATIGDYVITLIATNQYGCTDTFRMKTTAEGDIIFPNAFTPNPNGPNGGGYSWYNLDNDVFFPYAAYVEDFNMQIFDRWGELIFETKDIKIGWDGYYRGKLCQQDVYVWKASVKFIDGRTLTKAGDVTLLR
ncbi:MAG: PKD domain-containing protein [Bacteroidetes bacterium]|nr:PKD domain-containing protein [Bacteroidota bacterium]